MAQEQVAGLVRHGLTFAGGLLIATGVISEGWVQELSGGIMTLFGAVWSFVAKTKAAAKDPHGGPM